MVKIGAELAKLSQK